MIYMFRLSFDTYMHALEKAFPDLTSEGLLAKAHAQLLLEVQEKEVCWSHSAWEHEFTPRNVGHFRKSYRQYKRRYRYLFNKNDVTRKERADFLHFCGTHKLTWEGRAFMVKFRIKSAIATRIGRTR